MNYSKLVLFLTGTALLLMLLFPPFVIIYQGNKINAGYGFILFPPNNIALINSWVLLAQCLVVSLAGIILFFAFKKRG
jgi:hypothetical protein